MFIQEQVIFRRLFQLLLIVGAVAVCSVAFAYACPASLSCSDPTRPCNGNLAFGFRLDFRQFNAGPVTITDPTAPCQDVCTYHMVNANNEPFTVIATDNGCTGEFGRALVIGHSGI
jgi:hypothetical protein